MEKSYVETLSNLKLSATKYAHACGCWYPIAGSTPGTTCWLPTKIEADECNVLSDDTVRHFVTPRDEVNLMEWVGYLTLRGFTHVSFQDEEGDWTRRRPIGSWILNKFRDPNGVVWWNVTWRLYRSEDQYWGKALDVWFQGSEAVYKTAEDFRALGRRWARWTKPIRRRAPRRSELYKA